MVGSGDNCCVPEVLSQTPPPPGASRPKAKRHMRDEQLNAVGVSNATNSRSPTDLKSRIFIGNLNTTLVTKRLLHLLFSGYGDVKAISMHKGKRFNNKRRHCFENIVLRHSSLALGFAFIQYGDEMDALNAVLAQDGQLLSGQTIDVNLVTEPKPHQKACKKVLSSEDTGCPSQALLEIDGSIIERPASSGLEQNMLCNNVVKDNEQQAAEDNTSTSSQQTELSNSCNIFFDEMTAAAVVQVAGCLEPLPCYNRPEFLAVEDEELSNSTIESSKNATAENTNGESPCNQIGEPSASKRLRTCMESHGQNAKPTASYLQPQFDVLICGNCRTMFTSLPSFVLHKQQSKCRLRFVCHCGQISPSQLLSSQISPSQISASFQDARSTSEMMSIDEQAT